MMSEVGSDKILKAKVWIRYFVNTDVILPQVELEQVKSEFISLLVSDCYVLPKTSGSLHEHIPRIFFHIKSKDNNTGM